VIQLMPIAQTAWRVTLIATLTAYNDIEVVMSYRLQPTPAVLFLLLVLLALGCEKMVFHPDELKAKEKFNSISVGTKADDVVSRLGKPKGTITYQPCTKTYSYSGFESGKTIEFQFSERAANGFPVELRFLPDRAIVNRVLVYVDATVYAFYFVDNLGTIEYVDVAMS
jgi:hypothetical protein